MAKLTRSTSTETGPSGHQLAALFQEIAPPICGLALTRDRVSEGGFGYFVGEIRALRCPVLKSCSETVHGRVLDAEALECLVCRRCAARLVWVPIGGEDKVAAPILRHFVHNLDRALG